METFTAKARSGFYRTTEDAKTLLSSEVFVEFSNYSEGAADIWMDRLDSIGVETVESILEKIPAERMTDNTKEFTLELLKINQRRILQNRF